MLMARVIDSNPIIMDHYRNLILLNPTYSKSELYFEWKMDGDKSPIEYSDGLDGVSN